jgi:hypothetical protein
MDPARRGGGAELSREQAPQDGDLGATREQETCIGRICSCKDKRNPQATEPGQSALRLRNRPTRTEET